MADPRRARSGIGPAIRALTASSVRAPVGLMMRIRAQYRPALPAPRRSPWDVLVSTLAFTTFYGFIVVGGVLGWQLGHTALTVVVGALCGLLVTPAVVLLAGGFGGGR